MPRKNNRNDNSDGYRSSAAILQEMISQSSRRDYQLPFRVVIGEWGLPVVEVVEKQYQRIPGAVLRMGAAVAMDSAAALLQRILAIPDVADWCSNVCADKLRIIETAILSVIDHPTSKLHNPERNTFFGEGLLQNSPTQRYVQWMAHLADVTAKQAEEGDEEDWILAMTLRYLYLATLRFTKVYAYPEDVAEMLHYIGEAYILFDDPDDSFSFLVNFYAEWWDHLNYFMKENGHPHQTRAAQKKRKKQVKRELMKVDSAAPMDPTVTFN